MSLFIFDIRYNLYFDVGQVDEARERGEVVVIKVDSAQIVEHVWRTQVNSPVKGKSKHF